jgi:hypothetical protein
VAGKAAGESTAGEGVLAPIIDEVFGAAWLNCGWGLMLRYLVSRGVDALEKIRVRTLDRNAKLQPHCE